MGEEDMRIAARALFPALLAAGGFWVSGVFGMRDSIANPLLLAGSYMLGFGTLLYAERLGIERTPGFYAFYACIVAAAGLLATSFLKQPPEAVVNSFMVLPLAMLILPAVFQAIEIGRAHV